MILPIVEESFLDVSSAAINIDELTWSLMDQIGSWAVAILFFPYACKYSSKRALWQNVAAF